MRRQIVVLEVQFDDEAGEQPPARWDWPGITDDPGVRVLAAGPAEPLPTAESGAWRLRGSTVVNEQSTVVPLKERKR